MDKKLKNDYIVVRNKGKKSFGGSQEWYKGNIKGWGCGLIAATDILSYIRGENSFEFDDYTRKLMTNEKEYFHVFKKMGVSGLRLAHSLNGVFKKKKMPYRAKWGVNKKVLFSSIVEMLDNDIPVMISVGPGFFKKSEIDFYEYNPGNVKKFVPVLKCKDHYVTITGIKEYNSKVYLEISSWGERYYIDFKEYTDYVNKNDNYLFSNILYIKKL